MEAVRMPEAWMHWLMPFSTDSVKPLSGRLGFVRDGYLFSFRHALHSGTKEHIAIEGDHHETRLYVNGKLIETLHPDERKSTKDKKYKIIRTLRFPLQQTDKTLRSRVTNVTVESL